jgi:hypothetical protein
VNCGTSHNCGISFNEGRNWGHCNNCTFPFRLENKNEGYVWTFGCVTLGKGATLGHSRKLCHPKYFSHTAICHPPSHYQSSGPRSQHFWWDDVYKHA